MDEQTLIVQLFGLICVIIVIFIFINRLGAFARALENKASIKDQIILMLLFGLFSCYGTYGGVNVEGSIVNVRDLGPMCGGMICGPIVGIGSGLISAAYRFTYGGPTLIPCTVATILSGVIGAAIFYLYRKKFCGIGAAIASMALMEIIHMELLCLLSDPIETGIQLAEQVGPAMVIANTFGMTVFAFMIINRLKEMKTEKERNDFQSELSKKAAELDIASKIQKDIMPKNLPKIPGYDLSAKNIPAKEVSGDFYDFINLRDGKYFTMLIADVSGKSVPAALFMMLSRTIIHARTTVTQSIEEIIKKSNSQISRSSNTGMFLTAFYGMLEPESNKMWYINAGHNPPLLLRSGTEEFEELKPTGLALGILDTSEYECGETEFNTGDILFMYTDGITESINHAEEMFEEERLRKVILENREKTTEEIQNAVINAVNTFTEGLEQFDDITLIVLKKGEN